MHASCEPVPVPVVEWIAFAQPYIPIVMHNELYREWYAWTECDYTKKVALIRHMEGHPDLGSTCFHTRTLALKWESILDTMCHHDAASSRDSMRQTLVMASKDFLAVVQRSCPQTRPLDWSVALREGVQDQIKA